MGRSFPIELAQIGAVVLERDDAGSIKILKHNHEIILLLPSRQGLSDTVWKEVEKLSQQVGLRVIDYTLPDALSENRNDLRDKAGAKARAEMHRLEIELVKHTTPFLNENKWLIIDGSVRFIENEIWNYWKEKNSLCNRCSKVFPKRYRV